MRNLTATLCLTLAVLLGSAGMSVSQDFQMGLDAARRGDFAIAMREWALAAEQGNASAQYRLGWMYRNGLGVPQDDETAVKWWTLAAERGHTNAQKNLGWMYYGVRQDFATAMKWYTTAAEQESVNAQYYLGLMYYNGDGVLQDYVYAHMWWNIAASSGNRHLPRQRSLPVHKTALKNRDMVAKEMTPSQIEEAQALARECVAKNYKGC
jgi:hypothetical protein